MKTEILKIDKENIDISKIKFAADVLKGGGLVAFPTETVYGLGANALNENAVKNIFKAKGRPSDNPLIVHILNKNAASEFVKEIPIEASNLMDEYWPGPLTIILKKASLVPHIITAGLDTVALRVPAHPIALKLIEVAGLPIAAPSANVSGRPSPTEASHVIEDLFGKVDIIIDGGSVRIGLESTVIDLTQNPPIILRPGSIDIDMLNKIISSVNFDPSILSNHLNVGDKEHEIIPKSPGMKYKHYAPLAEVIVIEGEIPKVINRINEMLIEHRGRGFKVGVLATEQTKEYYDCEDIISLGDREKPETMASNLFGAFREFDKLGVSKILAEGVDDKGIGLAIMNRMCKAAAFNVIKI
jgi:L-threonylcarbamoyladenylate synthase